MADAPGKKAAVAVRDLPDRGRALCHGFIESVTYMPANQVASFIAIVIDHEAPAPASRGLMLGAKGGPGAGAAGTLAANAGSAPGSTQALSASAPPGPRKGCAWYGWDDAESRALTPVRNSGSKAWSLCATGCPQSSIPATKYFSRQEEQ